MLKDHCIRFDWTIKRLLRQKANFGVLEGFLTVFLNLSSDWTTNYSYEQGGGGGMSAAPIYLGLMAISGVYLIKDSFQFLFYKGNEKDTIK